VIRVPKVGCRGNEKVHRIEVVESMWLRGDLLETSQGSSCLFTTTFEGGKPLLCCMGFSAAYFGAKRGDLAQAAVWGGLSHPVMSELDIETKDVRFFNPVYRSNDDDADMSPSRRLKVINADLRRLGANFRFKLAKRVPQWLRRALA